MTMKARKFQRGDVNKPNSGGGSLTEKDVLNPPCADNKCNLPLQELETRKVMLVIGLQENPSMFLPLEYRSGEESDPVAIRYSLGWTVIGPVGEKMDGMCATSNFARMSVNADDLSTEDRTFESLKEEREFLTEDCCNGCRCRSNVPPGLGGTPAIAMHCSSYGGRAKIFLVRWRNIE
jgi:hypothetical protein